MKYPPHLHRRFAFSLVELSIVLVILGLLVGGVLSGQSLIKAASMRATIAQVNELTGALNAFRDKYFGLPGDIANGVSFWGASTTNGNGNGAIEATGVCSLSNVQSDPDCGQWNGERPESFKQLSLAGLVAGGYDGSITVGKGYPAVKAYPNAGMMFTGAWVFAPGSNMSAELYAKDKLYLYMGICAPAQLNAGTDSHNDCGIFPPEDAWNMDTKIDDGKPQSGKMIGESYNTTCVAASNTYALSNTAAACNPMISMGQ